MGGVCPGPRKCCEKGCTCSTTICVKGCSGLALPGATVTVGSLAGLLTDSTGCCAPCLDPLGGAGTRTVVVTHPSYTSNTSSQALTCAGTKSITLSTLASGFACTGCALCPNPVPANLTGNDGLGDFAMTFMPSFTVGDNTTGGATVYSNVWVSGCVTRTTINKVCAFDLTCTNFNKSPAILSLPTYFVLQCYQIHPVPLVFGLQMTSWVPACFNPPGQAQGFYYQAGRGCAPTTGGWTSYGGAGQTSLTCDPFDWSGFSGTNAYCPAPVGVCYDSCKGISFSACDLYGCSNTFTVTA